MENVKSKSISHIIEEKSLKIIKSILPDHWTTRDYKPDYGLDLAIEIFEKNKANYVTLGEHLFVQVKGVEKFCYVDKTVNDKIYQYIRYNIDVSLLLTVERMSPSVPVLLFLVNTSESKIYFICLNDYIEYCLVDDEWKNQKSKTLYLPQRNEINENSFLLLNHFSKRPKLYDLFFKIRRLYDKMTLMDAFDIISQHKNFLESILLHDAWEYRHFWPAMISWYKNTISIIENGTYYTNDPDELNKYDNTERIWDISCCPCSDYLTKRESRLLMNLFSHFKSGLLIMFDLYDSYNRNWFLPTSLGEICAE